MLFVPITLQSQWYSRVSLRSSKTVDTYNVQVFFSQKALLTPVQILTTQSIIQNAVEVDNYTRWLPGYHATTFT